MAVANNCIGQQMQPWLDPRLGISIWLCCGYSPKKTGWKKRDGKVTKFRVGPARKLIGLSKTETALELMPGTRMLPKSDSGIKLLVGKRDLRLGKWWFPPPTHSPTATIQGNILAQLKTVAIFFMSTIFFFFNLYNYVCVCFSVFYWFVSMFLFLLCIDCQIVIVWQFLQILKLYAWEPSYKKKIIENREQ